MCNWLKFVGRRTLDIYMLHIFFLPNLKLFHSYFSENNSLIIMLTIGIIVAILDIAVCLFVSLILRSSTTLSQWLFGEKAPNTIEKPTFLP